MYVIVTNHVNWHRENLRLDRENTGNSKTQFEWVPCITEAYQSLYSVFSASIHVSVIQY